MFKCTDRYVILGNHRDAWGFGAADPSSGTAQLLETVHVLGDFKKQGTYLLPVLTLNF